MISSDQASPDLIYEFHYSIVKRPLQLAPVQKFSLSIRPNKLGYQLTALLDIQSSVLSIFSCSRAHVQYSVEEIEIRDKNTAKASRTENYYPDLSNRTLVQLRSRSASKATMLIPHVEGEA